MRRKKKTSLTPWRALLTGVILLLLWLYQQQETTPIENPSSLTGRCVKVIDGDTFDVHIEGGNRERIRVLGIDCMETYQPEKLRKQARRYDVSTHVIRTWGQEAKKIARQRLEGEKVTLILPNEKPQRDSYGRLLCYVETKAGEDIGALLIHKGWAECRREPHPRQRKYYTLLDDAQRSKKGIFHK